MRRLLLLLSILAITISIFFFIKNSQSPSDSSDGGPQGLLRGGTPTASPSATPTASPSATPTPKPLTFSEMNALYGPCVHLPVLMYHHIQAPDAAKQNGNGSLTVNTDVFEKQLAYLNDKGYVSIDPKQLIEFFDGETPLPKKPVLLTFDDGYDDFATTAVPLLKRYNLKSTLFVSTGLIENPGYLTWSTIQSINDGQFYFGNHTWSHKNMGGSLETSKREISTAAIQLADHGLDPLKVFAYPYGIISKQTINYLSESGYQLAFTTTSGKTQCQKQRLNLPRTRIGNASLSTYGL